jgi:hypothetical protein
MADAGRPHEEDTVKGWGSLTNRLTMIAVAACVIGGVLFGAALLTTASATSDTGCTSCTISVSQTTGLDANTPVQVTGTGFSPKATGAVVECNMAPGEPTISVPDEPPDFTNLGSLPVSCTTPDQSWVHVTKSGTIFAGLGISIGTTGPPALGTDTGGVDALTDANNYPCPPTQTQVAAGVTCAMVFRDSKGESASEDISFVEPYSVVTTTTTTTTAPPPAGCTPTSAQNTGGPPTVTVDPATCLVGNQKVTVSGTGLKASQTGSVLECNVAPGEPTVYNTIASKAIPVGCSNPLTTLAPTNASGDLPSTSFVILTGTIGPPGTASQLGAAGTGSPASTDSPSQALTDSAGYPCPPTPTQQAAGVTCDIIYGDLGGDQVLVPIKFGADPGVTGNAPGASSKAGGETAAAVTRASSGQLAFTGSGTAVVVMALVGLVLVAIGGSLLVVTDAPRRRLRR